ncbi:ethylene-insensitive protein 2.2 [Castanea sativa]|uniref:ethylene-insensitive protein 2.2 n=1 Tax=Castanea sativa TaxID=21020 RepID=UPI003F650070
MEAENLNPYHLPDGINRLLPVVVPVLLVSVGYVDPGKWAATVEGGARFGSELVVLMLIFNFAAILCQYLSARIGLVTGRDLAQICSDEYDRFTCIILGVQTEVSVIALDLTMILGLAHGLNLLFGWDLFTCVFLTAVNAVLFPPFAILLENCKAKFLCICMSGFIFLFIVLGVLISQPEITPSMNGMLTISSGESAFALMSLLGANIMPHNFFLHSSIVQHLGSPNISKDALCHNHFFAILGVFSGIYVVNYVLMISAASVFNSSGLVMLTFQDAMTLMEQVFMNPFVYLFVLFFSNQIMSLSWSVCGRVVLHDFLKLDIPGWLHCVTIRVIAIVPALYCVWSLGAEGMYQLLIFTQVMVALLLPSSVIPLFRVAASRSIMGVYKISQIVEFLAIVTFIGMLGLKLIFVVEMIFGNSDWVSNLKWNMGSSISFSYVVLLVTACASLCLMLWLLATPLKSASARLDAQVWDWDVPKAVPDTSTEKEESDLTGSAYHGEAPIQKQEPLLAQSKGLESHSDGLVADPCINLPETIMESDHGHHLTTVEENHSNSTFTSSLACGVEEMPVAVESVPVSVVPNLVSDVKLLDTRTVKSESMDPVEKTLGMDGDLQTEKDDDEPDTWEPDESGKGVSGSTQSLTSEGPGSFRSLSGRGDEGGSGTGSLSRLAGLGRAARRQLAGVLDEFWGQLFDFHGQTTQEAKTKKLDVLLGVDSKPSSSSLKVDTTAQEFSGYLTSVGGRGSDHLSNSSLYNSPKQQNVQRSSESAYGVQRGSSSMWSNSVQLLDAYVQNSSRNVPDSSERRYSSVRNLPSMESSDYQPATVHGYQLASYRMAVDRNSDHLNSQMESTALRSPSLGVTSYSRDSMAFALGQKLQNGLSSSHISSFQNPAISRESQLQCERSYYDPCSSGPADTVVSSTNTKKYHSLPDMSGFSVPQRDLYLSDKSAQWDSPIQYGPSVSRTVYEQSLYPNSGSRTGAPLVFDELSPTKVYRDGFSSQLNSSSRSLWSRQPFEQFGVADKNLTVGSEGVRSRSSSITQEATSIVDSEAKLLQSFRHCIVRLLKLEGSDWLFKQNDGADEDLIDRVAAREKFLYEAETREMNRGVQIGEPQYSSDRKSGSAMRTSEAGSTNFLISSVPNCGEGCVWRIDLIVSFGVWCIHRILDLSLMESRPELWGKYTYVLNRLQGIIDPAFSKPRSPMTPCFCLHIPEAYQQRSSPPVSNGMLPPASKPGRGKCTTAVMVLDIIKDVEIAISCRKGRTGTAAGDVAFPKGKENLASVLKRYKRRLSNKPVGAHEGSGPRKVPTSSPYIL